MTSYVKMIISVSMISSVCLDPWVLHNVNSFHLKKARAVFAVDTLVESYMDNLFAIVDANLCI